MGMGSFKLFFVIFIINRYTALAQISDKRLCADPECKVPISEARTLLKYSSPDSKILSFVPNAHVVIFSKSAGTHANLWGVEINGKRGYVPKHMIRETKVFVKNPNVLVATEAENKTDTPQVPLVTETVAPDKVKEQYEVVDGTTIYLNAEDIAPSSTESPILSTSLPSDSSKGKESKRDESSSSSNSNGDKTENLPQVKATQEAEFSQSESSEKLTSNHPDKNTLDSKEFNVAEGPAGNSDASTVVDNSAGVRESNPDKQNNAEADKGKEEESKQPEVNSKTEDVEPEVDPNKSVVGEVFSTLSNWITDKGEQKPTEEKQPADSQEIDSEEDEEDDEDYDEEDAEVSEEIDEEAEAVATAANKAEEKADSKQNTPPPGPISEEQKDIKVEEINPTMQGDNLNSANDINDKPMEDNNKITDEDLSREDIKENDNNIESTEGNHTSNAEVEKSNAQNVINDTYNDPQLSTEQKLDSPTVGAIETKEQTIPEASESTEEKSVPSAAEELPLNNINAVLSTRNSSEAFLDREQEKSVKDSSVPPITTTEIPLEIPQPLDVGFEQTTLNPVEHLKEAESAAVDNIETTQETPPETIASPNLMQHTGDPLKQLLEPLEPLHQEETPANDTTETDSVESADSNLEDDAVPVHSHNVIDIIQDASIWSKVHSQPSSSEYVEEASAVEEDSLLLSSNDQDVSSSTGHKYNDEYAEKVPVAADSAYSEVVSSTDSAIDESPGLLDSIYSLFGRSNSPTNDLDGEQQNTVEYHEASFASADKENPLNDDSYCDADPRSPHCLQKTHTQYVEENTFSEKSVLDMDLSIFTSDVFLYLATTAISVILFLLGYVALDRCRREGPLIARINKLEKDLLICSKENQILQEKVEGNSIDNLINTVPNEIVNELKQQLMETQSSKLALEEQVQALEKELENSTEVGMELNRMLSEILSSQSGSDMLKANIEQLQRQLIEQQATINSVNESLQARDTENHELMLELEISNKKVVDLQGEVDKLLLNVLKIEEEKDQQQNDLQSQLNLYKAKYEEMSGSLSGREDAFNKEIQALKLQLADVQRNLELKTKEYDILKENVKAVKSAKSNSEALRSLLDVSTVKAELEQLKSESKDFAERLRREQENNYKLEKKVQAGSEECVKLKERYDEADKEKVEAQTKLEVLTNYFKEREAQLQKELSKQESLWTEKQGEATSTIERIKYMQEELQNYKAQNEALKQEILNQEVDLKSQISVLEKKVNENWVSARQAERKLEESRQEAAQLRNRLTMRERALNEEKSQNRLQSPIEQNGEAALSPMHIESPASPPLLFGGRHHITKSPPLPGLPPFLPPPPFMPPPLVGVPPFMPPPPDMFPGDHRPPPLGRMSSPPLNSRYSPDSRAYSPYDRNSPSPPYDSEYGASPPPMRGYGAYNDRDDRRDYKRPPPPPRTNGRPVKGSAMSSGGSANSNESLERISQQHSKV